MPAKTAHSMNRINVKRSSSRRKPFTLTLQSSPMAAILLIHHLCEVVCKFNQMNFNTHTLNCWAIENCITKITIEFIYFWRNICTKSLVTIITCYTFNSIYLSSSCLAQLAWAENEAVERIVNGVICFAHS